MKKIIFLMLCIFLNLSCSKDSSYTAQELIDKYQSLLGEWGTENQTVIHFWGGSTVNPDHLKLTISQHLEYYALRPDQSIEVGTIRIYEQNEDRLLINFIPRNKSSKIFEWPLYGVSFISPDSISIGTVGVNDGGEDYHYVRIMAAVHMR